MAKLYTRTGDDGTTGLFDGGRVRKDDLRVAAYGDVDELNAQIGLTISGVRDQDGGSWDTIHSRLLKIQSELFVLGAELATPQTADASKQQAIPHITAEMNTRLESWIDEASSAAMPLKTFVLPGGSQAASNLHICRTVCRRAERSVVTLSAGAAINPSILVYLNRLSDLLFAWARQTNEVAGVGDVPWVNPAQP